LFKKIKTTPKYMQGIFAGVDLHGNMPKEDGK
jgi:hypothetical protein